MNQFLTLDKNIAKTQKKQDFGYFQVSRMPKTVEQREAEFEAERERIAEEKRAFEKMKAETEVRVNPVVKRRRRKVKGGAA